MIAVELPEADLLPWIAPYDGQVAVAALNSPTSSAVSGPPEAIRALEAALRRAGTPTRAVRINRPFHSPAMDPLLPPLRDALKDIEPLPFAVPFHSTALPGAVDPRLGADYWAHNLRDQVRFGPTVADLVADGVDTFVEIGPHGALRGAVEETALAHGTRVHAVGSLRRGEPGPRALLGAAASLFAQGVPVSTESLFPYGGQVVDTPLVRWQKDRYWLDAPPRSSTGSGTGTEAAAPAAGAAEPAAVPAPRPPEEIILGEIAEVLGVPAGKFGEGTRLRDFGLDSMLAIRLSTRVQTLFGHRISPAEFFGDGTLPELVGRLADLVARPGDPGTGTGPGAAHAVGTDRTSLLEELSDMDAEDLLDELAARQLLDPPEAADGAAPAREHLRTLPARERSFQLAPCAHGQAGIWFMQQLAPEAVPYNLMMAARIPGEVDEPALRRAVRAVVERHPALRTAFVEAGGRPYQLILDEPVHEFLAVDATGLDTEAVHEALAEHGHRPLDLDQGPLLRVVLMSRGPRDHHLLLVIHHVAADAASVDIVVQDLQELYEEARRGDLAHQEPAACYTRFVEWEREWLGGADAEAALRWWSERLAAPPPHLDLPRPAEMGTPGAGRPAADRPAGVVFEGEDLTFRWNADEARRLKAFAVQEGVSVSTLVLAGFFATLHHTAGAEDVVLGTAVAQRGEAGRERAVGYYLNTAPVRARPAAHRTFRELLREVHEFTLGMLGHMNYPLDLLASKLNPPRAEGRAPWFDFAVNWLSDDAFTHVNSLFHGIGEPEPSGSLRLVPVPLRRRIAKFDLEITMSDVADDVVGHVQYKPSFLERDTVTTLLEHFRSVLLTSVRRPDQALEHLAPVSRPQEADQ